MCIRDRYVDVLREIGNIGSGNATTAIASMLNLRLNMNVPKVELLSFQEFGSAISAEDETIVGIYLGLEQDIEGSMMFLMKLDLSLIHIFPANEVTSVVTLDPKVEQEIMSSVKQTEQGAYLTMDPEKTKAIMDSVETEIAKLEKMCIRDRGRL